MSMIATIHHSKNHSTINIDVHPATFHKWWKECQRSWVTGSAAKYLDVRRAFGVYVLDGPTDAVSLVWDTSLRHCSGRG